MKQKRYYKIVFTYMFYVFQTYIHVDTYCSHLTTKITLEITLTVVDKTFLCCFHLSFYGKKSECLKQTNPNVKYFTCSCASSSSKIFSFLFLFSLILETSGLSSLNSSLCSSTWKSGFSNMTLKRSSLRRLGRFWKTSKAWVSYKILKQTYRKLPPAH